MILTIKIKLPSEKIIELTLEEAIQLKKELDSLRAINPPPQRQNRNSENFLFREPGRDLPKQPDKDLSDVNYYSVYPNNYYKQPKD